MKNVFEVLGKGGASSSKKAAAASRTPGAKAYTTCPLCQRTVPAWAAEAHVSQCLATPRASQQAPTPAATAPALQPSSSPLQTPATALKPRQISEQPEGSIQVASERESPNEASAQRQAVAGREQAQAGSGGDPGGVPPSASGTPDTAPAAAAPAQGKGDPYTIDIDDGDDDDLVEVVEVEVERAGAAMPRRPLRVVQQQPLASEAAATAGPAEPAKLPGVNAFEVMRRSQLRAAALTQNFFLERTPAGAWLGYWWAKGTATPAQQQLAARCVWTATMPVGRGGGGGGGGVGLSGGGKESVCLMTNVRPGEGGEVSWSAADLPSNALPPEGRWRAGPSALKSGLQKAVRLGRGGCAVRAALHLMKEDDGAGGAGGGGGGGGARGGTQAAPFSQTQTQAQLGSGRGRGGGRTGAGAGAAAGAGGGGRGGGRFSSAWAAAASGSYGGGGGPQQLLRRLSIICVEDSLLHPGLQLVVWLMAAQAKGYVLGRSHVDALLALTYQLAAVGVRDALPRTPWGRLAAAGAAGGGAGGAEEDAAEAVEAEEELFVDEEEGDEEGCGAGAAAGGAEAKIPRSLFEVDELAASPAGAGAAGADSCRGMVGHADGSVGGGGGGGGAGGGGGGGGCSGAGGGSSSPGGLGPQEAGLVKALLLRAAYGGMACDVQLLRGFAGYWAARFLGEAAPPPVAPSPAAAPELAAATAPAAPPQQQQPYFAAASQQHPWALTQPAPGPASDRASDAYFAVRLQGDGDQPPPAAACAGFVPAAALMVQQRREQRSLQSSLQHHQHQSCSTQQPQHPAQTQWQRQPAQWHAAPSAAPWQRPQHDDHHMPAQQHHTQQQPAGAEALVRPRWRDPDAELAYGSSSGGGGSGSSGGGGNGTGGDRSGASGCSPMQGSGGGGAASSSRPSAWLSYLHQLYDTVPVPAALASTASVGPLRRSDVPLSAVDFHVSDVVPQLLSRADVAAAVARRLLAKRAARSAAAAAAAPEGPEREEKRAAAAAALAEVEAMSDEAVAAQLTMMAPEDAEDGIKSAMWLFRSSRNPKAWIHSVSPCCCRAAAAAPALAPSPAAAAAAAAAAAQQEQGCKPKGKGPAARGQGEDGSTATVSLRSGTESATAAAGPVMLQGAGGEGVTLDLHSQKRPSLSQFGASQGTATAASAPRPAPSCYCVEHRCVAEQLAEEQAARESLAAVWGVAAPWADRFSVQYIARRFGPLPH
ncbi:hypothetical protein CHLRE_01g047350v5 [Chlamydomonas reinhardtii]|uniref:UBZ4-type domain-containing protein n=1 Tax=Chlamydomonas reinhardtii TaxID=3055 RepID=A0A2K3E7W2_CHLRE|nr:uncharacterized protein CHLRE_01g047350v5 [Chlamydomonas reinhardtii]PNW88847.1 hypothetical protein CHLRE_01g047350v5 [Chlamydomonas reinhardtii]